ncbi:MAG: hypothetical protein NXI19_06920 [Alphaproteobacteria bacterium]|nr:hypothetical protein [Alphaproteobacteria bacterium]
MRRPFPSLILLPGLLALAMACIPAAVRAEIPQDRKIELHGIAASCAAFYQAAFFELDLPIEGNEAKREQYLAVIDALSEQLLEAPDRKPWFEEHVVRRSSTVVTLLQLQPDHAGPKVLENLPKCDALLPEMTQAAGLE